MAADTVFVRPRRGLILAGIPRGGAAIPRGLAEAWIADQLVEPVGGQASQPTEAAVTRPLKQGRSK